MQHNVITGNSNSSTLNDNLISISIELECDLMQFSISFSDYYTYHLLRNSFLHQTQTIVQKVRLSMFDAVGIYPEFTYSLYTTVTVAFASSEIKRPNNISVIKRCYVISTPHVYPSYTASLFITSCFILLVQYISASGEERNYLMHCCF